MDLLVAADDRTGAFETAAALADRGANGGCGVPVTVWPAVDSGSGVRVVDLESRHVDPSEAAARAADLTGTGPTAHKIDSTLRGNWAAELAARHRSSGMPVLVVPALPDLGRVCIEGVVTLDGRPVGELGDVRGGAVSSRPTEHLAQVGVDAVSLGTLDAVAAWLRDGSGIAVADAATTDEVHAIVGAWRAWNEPGAVRSSPNSTGARHLLAGTSAAIAATLPPGDAEHEHRLRGTVLVVVGSANAAARRQLDALVESGFDPEFVLATAEPSRIVSHVEAAAAASALVQAMHDRLLAGDVDVIVVIGGDTAAAVLGDDPATVYGTVGAGTALLRSARYSQPIVTRAGGFGGRDALVDLVSGTLRQ